MIYLCSSTQRGAGVHPRSVPRVHRGRRVPGHVGGAHGGSADGGSGGSAPAWHAARRPDVWFDGVAVLLFALDFTEGMA